MSRLLRIISLDVSVEDVQRLKACLADHAGRRVSVQHLTDAQQAIERLPLMRADALFIDEDLDVLTGVEVIHELRSVGEQRPIIATTRVDCGYLAADLMRAGADGYLAKHDLRPGFIDRVLDRAIQNARGRKASDRLRRNAVRAMLAEHGPSVAGLV